jgi:hypothetical protein
MKKTKKAEISIQFLILGVIGVFILGIIFLNPHVMEFIAEKFPNMIPWYNNTKPPVQVPELIRYSISEDKVQYYDGLNWIYFPKDKPEDWSIKVKVGTKELTHNQARYNFARYYYKGPRIKDVKERVIHLKDNLNFQNEIKTWYSNAGIWQFISPASPFDAIIREIVESQPNLGTIEVDLIGANYFSEVGQSETGFTLGPAESLDSPDILDPDYFHFVYNNGIKTGVFISNPPGAVEVGDRVEGKVFAFVYGKDRTKFIPDETAMRVGYLKKDQTGKYLIYIYGSSGKPSTIITTPATFTYGVERVSIEDYNIVAELLRGDYYMEDLKDKFKENKIPNRKVYGKFYLDKFNNLRFTKLSKDLTTLEGSSSTIAKESILYQSIVPEAIKWRDSVLSDPMCFCYTSETDCALLKVEELSANTDLYFIVDLNKPIGPCTQTDSTTSAESTPKPGKCYSLGQEVGVDKRKYILLGVDSTQTYLLNNLIYAIIKDESGTITNRVVVGAILNNEDNQIIDIKEEQWLIENDIDSDIISNILALDSRPFDELIGGTICITA